ncbi:alanine-rich protein [Mycobacterium tuberculosis]|nr:alanine-rich protein [Mycobacterium tuberculosis]
MSKAGSTVGPAPLVACSGGTSDVIEPRRGVAIIGHSCRVGTQIDDSRISQTHLRAVSDDGRWRIVGNIPRGMFVGGRRGSSVTVSDKTLIRFGDPPGGKALTFEVVRPSDSAAQHGRVQPSADLSDDPAHNAAPVAPDPGVVRAGAAAAARRRELDISQRSLAADGIINAGALIAFEKGRSWPGNGPGQNSKKCCSGPLEPSRESVGASPPSPQQTPTRPPDSGLPTARRP